MEDKYKKYGLMLVVGLILAIILSGCLSKNTNNENSLINNSIDFSSDIQTTNVSEDNVIIPETIVEENTSENTSVVEDNSTSGSKILAWKRAHSSSGSSSSSDSSSSSSPESSNDVSNDVTNDVTIETTNDVSTETTNDNSTIVDPITDNTDSHPMIPADINWSVTNSIIDVASRGFDTIKRPGDIISYSVTVTNTGNVTLTNLVATDIATLSSDSGTSRATLAPRENWTLYGTYTASINDMITLEAITQSTDISCTELGSKTTIRTVPITCKYTTYKPNAPVEEAQYAGVTQYSADSYYVGGDGHRITLLVNSSAVNPTFDQLVQFIKADKTNEIPYNTDSFVCGDYAELVQNNAEMAGYRCAWVSIDFTGETSVVDPETGIVKVGHACNLFNTVDMGFVGIDCTRGNLNGASTGAESLDIWDSVVSLVVGGQYQQNLLYTFTGSEQVSSSSVGTIAAYFPFRDSQINNM